MQFTSALAVAALASTAAAWYPASNSSSVTVDYVTDVVTSYTTYCPEATTLTYNSVTYTITEPTTLTVTNCPCTIVKPVTTSSVVYCNTCATTSVPVYYNTTTPGSVGTTSVKASATPTPSTITTSGGNQVLALSGASLAGLLGLAAYVL
jgi:hypothetical protein